jgi:ABC-2 type transport system ATP-binding protein
VNVSANSIDPRNASPNEPTAHSVSGSSATPIGFVCRGLVTRFGPVRALDGFDLEVEPGECVGIVGRNGAGKSTLLRAMLGIGHVDAGTVRFTPLLGRMELLARTGYVPDALSIYDWMTVGDALDFTARCQPRFDEAWCGELLALLALDRSKPVRSLSRGMQARLAFVLGLAHRPDLVLLDEPLLGVDAVTHDSVLEVLARMRSRDGATIVLATHQLGDLARLVDRVVFVERGRVGLSIATDDLLERTKRLVVLGVPPAATPAFPAEAGVIVSRAAPEGLVVTFDGARDAAERAIRAIAPDARIHHVDLSIHEACADRLRALEVKP